jgi:vacuolar protein sorting-associated protein 13A/C
MHASASIAFGINYWNLANSHWEPVIEPWTVSADVRVLRTTGQGSNRPQVTNTQTGGLVANVTSHERLEINISTTFVETALAAVAAWNQENLRPMKRARGGVAPYLIRNQTGADLQLWSSHEEKDVDVTTLNNNQEKEWRFDDWKSLREVCYSRVSLHCLTCPCSTCQPLDTMPLALSSKASHGNK